MTRKGDLLLGAAFTFFYSLKTSGFFLKIIFAGIHQSALFLFHFLSLLLSFSLSPLFFFLSFSRAGLSLFSCLDLIRYPITLNYLLRGTTPHPHPTLPSCIDCGGLSSYYFVATTATTGCTYYFVD
eukprot:gb/GEZN01019262.1/.p1 GENE.gb/GEZN01019262.1/~~gb/GEZN01019262.1/.p1  ORF type:complete len:126 (+),score=6.86 gb/GEZN01019262.1/:283-660(+)